MSADLPRTDFDSMKDDPTIRPAGTEAEQRRLSLLAWEMMEVWGPPGKNFWTRIAADWLAGQPWQVALGGEIIPHDVPSLIAAIRARGHRDILATQVDAELLQPSAVWRLPLDLADMDHVRQHHLGSSVVFFTEARDFLIHCDGRESTAYAGPRSFVQAALQSWLEPVPEDAAYQPPATLQALSQDTLDAMRHFLAGSETGRFQVAELDRHYRPFLV